MEVVMDEIDQVEQELRASQDEQVDQEAYYWHVIAEFYGMCKHFGVKRVMEDYATFKETVEVAPETPRIQLV